MESQCRVERSKHLRDAFQELKRLTEEHNISVKRGSRKRFLEKIWRKFRKFFQQQNDISTRGHLVDVGYFKNQEQPNEGPSFGRQL